MILLSALAVAIIFASGTFLLLQRDLTRMVVGIILISNSSVLFIIASGLTRGTAPIYPLAAPEASATSDPLVQAMALTALVIGFGVAALLLAMVYRLYGSYGNVDVHELGDAERQDAEALDRAGEPPEQEELSANEQDILLDARMRKSRTR